MDNHDLLAMLDGTADMIDVTPPPLSVMTRQRLRRAFMLKCKRDAARFEPWQMHRKGIDRMINGDDAQFPALDPNDPLPG